MPDELDMKMAINTVHACRKKKKRRNRMTAALLNITHQALRVCVFLHRLIFNRHANRAEVEAI
ncbi:hypothetical protein D9M69_637230 [compost metagenome]